MARILVVDDSETQVAAIAQTLTNNGHEVITAHNGETGVEYAKTHSPDLVLMDVVMPGLGGFKATREISKDPSTSHIPVIIISTKDQETDKLWGSRQGAKAYLVKPFEEDELLDMIDEFLN